MMADLFLPLKPRSDIALLNGLIHLLIRTGQIDCEYIANHTTGFAELARFVEKYTPAYVSRITGLSEDLIIKTADLYGNAQAAFIGWTMGVNHSTQGAETVNAINNLALITGNIGRAGASPFSITGQCNAMGTREAGFASSLPGYRKFESAEDREELARLWKIACGSHSDFPRLGLSRHRRGRRRQEDSRALDHRDESDCFVPESRRPEARIGDAGVSWSCRMDFIPRPLRSLRTSSSLPPSGVRKRERTRTPSGASAK